MNKFFIIISILFVGCKMTGDDDRKNIARFNDSYLNKIDFSKLMTNYSEEDSIVRANNIINNWAINKILIERAKLNLDESRLNEIESLVEDYRSDLLTDSYLEALVNSTINLEVDSLEIQSLFDSNKNLFLLNEDIYRLIFVELPQDFSDTYEIRKRVRRFNEKDQYFLDSISFRYNKYSFDTKTWVSEKKLLNEFDFLNSYSYRSLKNYNFYQYKDSLSLYLIKIVDSAKKGEISPIENVLSTLEYMSLNQRKKEAMLRIKTNILKNALLNNKLEIY
ncbi:MAG: hypothetical protein L7T60_04465 [Flavobacteriaceae bacterium]|nr:hypothetical protein [Flavobacteriaceae bacterium]